jgi:hypothetical protein
MAGFVPIYYRSDGSYLIAVRFSYHASACEAIELVPREILKEIIADSRIKGQVAEPYISHGFN